MEIDFDFACFCRRIEHGFGVQSNLITKAIGCMQLYNMHTDLMFQYLKKNS